MNTNTNISAYILCGGKSSRMQTEKGLVNYLDKPFIQWVIEAVKPVTQNIFLVTDNQSYSKFGYPLVPDVYKAKGPVGGIYSALSHSINEYNLMLSCDIPNISTSIINRYLVTNLSNSTDVSFLSDNRNSYPLIAIYNKRVTPLFLEAIKLNKLKLVRLLNELNCQKIRVNNDDFQSLRNINTKEELHRIEKKEKEFKDK